MEYDVDAAAPRTARRTAAIRAPSRSSRASAPVAVRASIRARLASMTPLRASPSRAAPTSPVGTAPHGGGTPAVVRADRDEIQNETKNALLQRPGDASKSRAFCEPSLNRRLFACEDPCCAAVRDCLAVPKRQPRSGVFCGQFSAAASSKQSRRRANSKIPTAANRSPKSDQMCHESHRQRLAHPNEIAFRGKKTQKRQSSSLCGPMKLRVCGRWAGTPSQIRRARSCGKGGKIGRLQDFACLWSEPIASE